MAGLSKVQGFATNLILAMVIITWIKPPRLMNKDWRP